MFRTRLTAAVALGAVAAGLTVRHAGGQPAAAPKAFAQADVDFYEKEVRPILAANCLKCHGADEKIKGGLSLATRESVLEGGDTGPAVDLKTHAASLLLKAVDYKDESMRMPPKGKLPDKDIAVLRKWVGAGLPYPADKLTAKGGAKHKEKGGVVTEEAKRYWAFQPVKRPAVPAVKNPAWVQTPIDAFVLAKLDEKNLRPVRPADRAAIVRRAYYDLWGLPPTPEQVDAFVKDPAADAWPKLIDALLASPHYGEKWGRHWLDVVRYAETNGYERDGPKPYAWRYRDYVIRAFNADKPFDVFVKEQLAGDELPGYNPEAVIATGFYRLGIWDDEPADPKQALYDGYDDLVTVTGQGFLGITLNCNRCHDHKADPFPHADYYRFLSFFRDIRPFSDTRGVSSSTNMTDITPPERRKVYEAELLERQAKVADLTTKMRAVEDAAIKKMPAEDQRASEGPDRPQVVAKVPGYLSAREKADYVALKKDRTELEKRPRPLGQEFALSVNNCDPRPPAVFVLPRGNPHAKGAEVQPGFPQVLGVPDPTIPAPPAGVKTSGRRTVLANWIASKDNPLTARVMVNRVWQGHFGRGIVPSSNDFGKLGEAPTHPELLDWLAADFVDGGWTLKRLHKLIMTSAVYQLASAGDDTNLRADPANTRLWRFPMRRLTAEEVRDSVLAVSGSLNPKMFGASVYPKIPREVLAGQSVPGQGWPETKGDEANRRTVYVGVKRSLQVPILATHDQADTDNSCPVRYTTTVPTQALGLLNGEFTNEQAVTFAVRLQRESPGDVPAQVTRAVRLTTGRTPPPAEVAKDVAFVNDQRSRHGLDERTALARYCLLLLNTNEFVYLD
ncbi:PSD1 and planctomycete cytochrome C domain-containing protein [Urbifossiella limnaea]|uniref:Planctomycete cytochrome C n=1 Tax=Urbifossiella limnaea TaxID=2528023 RepID=A0A517XT49_9BACT|nr:PSD1 and planctomycete cytochrome C domain-containing protein [Urbifossiella limnaea]QDU20706.1 Planctomycete cytochrome C [Urbifossiella limnaea]